MLKTHTRKRHLLNLTTIMCFVVFVTSLESDWLTWLNLNMGQAIIDLRHTSLNAAFEFYTKLGNTSVQIAWYALLTFVLLKAGRKTQARSVVIAGLAVGIVVTIVKHTVAFARPDWGLPIPTSFSFPSGHSAGVACLLTLVYRSYPSTAMLFLTILAGFTMGLSRLYLGVHWTSDVIAGWMLGITIAINVTSK